MARAKEIALFCRINAGGFSGERVVEITQVDGKVKKALAPRHYCWAKGGRPLHPEEPKLGAPIEGLVAARRLGDLPNGQVRVNTPDGEVFVVSPDIIVERPVESEVNSNVPV